MLVTATNNGTSTYSGYRPEVELYWGTFDVQWEHRSHKAFALPADWAKMSPGQSRQKVVELPLPAAGDYSVFATLDVFRNEKGENLYLVGAGSGHSDAKLLHVP